MERKIDKVALESDQHKAFIALCDACDKMRETYHAVKEDAGFIELGFKSGSNHWVLNELTAEEFAQWRKDKGIPESAG